MCGKVKFEISGEPSSLSYCHCSRCRKSSGIFSAVLIGKVDDLKILQGEDDIARNSPENPWTHSRCFCNNCGTSLGDLATDFGIYVVAASALDDDPGIRPTAHIHTASKPDWYEIEDNLKKFDGDYVKPVPDS